MLLGVASIVMVADTIEAFLSPRRWLESVRIAIGLIAAVILVL